MDAPILFEEKQFLGYNKFSIIRRSILSIFCFVLYYWSENPKPVSVGAINIGAYPVGHGSGHLFFLLGMLILLLSGVLVFVMHTHTVMTDKAILLSGFWTSRKVEIPLADIISVRKVRFRETLLSRPSYHHLFKGRIRFYTRGNHAIELARVGGPVLLIGTQRSDELFNLIYARVLKKNT